MRRNVNLIGLMQYLNFGRKYESAAVTGDISRLPDKNCLLVNPVHETEAKSAQGMMDSFTDLRQEFATFRKDICDKDDTSKLICSKIDTSKSDNIKGMYEAHPESKFPDVFPFKVNVSSRVNCACVTDL
ncbi:hypothetical protein TNCV_38001 [Trichonephila clavipes]|nr:hypothetical protein TNCV_38001 [Trichonephila clavipes]